MRPIQLTEKHREKLLEMCIALFPEYSPFDLELKSQYDGSEYNIFFKYMEKHMFYIHWFEFCITHLLERVAKHYEENVLSTKSFSKFLVMQKVTNELNKNHPVDTLYDIWKNPKNYLPEL
jgi:hypothetical protein